MAQGVGAHPLSVNAGRPAVLPDVLGYREAQERLPERVDEEQVLGPRLAAPAQVAPEQRLDGFAVEDGAGLFSYAHDGDRVQALIHIAHPDVHRLAHPEPGIGE